MRSAVLLWLLVLQVPSKPDQSPEAILDRAASVIRRGEPSWNLSKPICNIPPLMDEQEAFSCGNVQVGPGVPTTIVASVTVHQIINPAAVSRWMTNLPTQSPVGWAVVPYDLGVPAYLSTMQGTARAGITFGKGRFVVTVNGASKMDVERIARFLLGQIAD